MAVIDQSDGRKYEVEEPFNLETEAQNYAKFRKLTTSDVWENMPGDLATGFGDSNHTNASLIKHSCFSNSRSCLSESMRESACNCAMINPQND